ncbi:MAG: polysaccharide deacetylase family protein [Dehalococcoidia bacterium]|nr:polysaccharide deacetylase family protein [Dehalococcoidia bacterium]
MSVFYPPILAYHRIGRFKHDHVPTVSIQAFESQLKLLAKWRITVAPLEALAERIIRGGALPRRTTAITFDDGYEETYSNAWPLLKRFNFPSTVFVTPGEVGLPGFATWEQVRAMAIDGVTVGNHTMHHTYLPLAKDEALPGELIESKRIIEEKTGRPVRLMSYPVGGYTRRAQEVVRDAGYLAACTTNRGTRGALDPFAIRRVKMNDRDAHSLLLAAKLSGYYDVFRRLRQPG